MAMVPHERSLVKRFQDRPFALLGVNCDFISGAAERAVRDKEINWRSWRNRSGGGGTISAAWRTSALPAIYLIDHQGVIRYHKVGWMEGSVLDGLVEDLVKAAEKESGAKGQ